MKFPPNKCNIILNNYLTWSCALYELTKTNIGFDFGQVGPQAGQENSDVSNMENNITVHNADVIITLKFIHVGNFSESL